MRKFLSLIIVGLMSLPAMAGSIDEARSLVKEGDYWGARKMLESLAANNPKVASSGLYLYLTGVCDYESHNFDLAERNLQAAKAKGVGAANLYLGRIAFQQYDFDKASELYGDFRNIKDKTNLVTGDTADDFERELMVAQNAISRVEQIVVLDSVAVPAQGFFEAYKLPSSAGRLIAPSKMPLADHRDGVEVAFVNEGGDYMMWGEPDSVGNVRIVESLRLTDGKWHEPVATPDMLNLKGYADYPFMMPDGVTLYYASDGEESMGGYDIFVATRDPQTGEYLQPQNIGMPFNSPADDYMLAIDEENGVGWWATDRNNLGDKVTIYIYKVNDVRRNYNPDMDDILSKARLSDFRSTWNAGEEEEYKELLSKVSAVSSHDKQGEQAEFYFPVGNGKYYKFMSDFKSSSARRAMKKYLLSKDALDKEEDRLLKLRQRFARTQADNVREQIRHYEKEIEKQRAEVKQLRSEVYRFEKEN